MLPPSIQSPNVWQPGTSSPRMTQLPTTTPVQTLAHLPGGRPGPRLLPSKAEPGGVA